MSEQDVLKPQFTLEQIREARFKLLSEMVLKKTVQTLLAAMAESEEAGAQAIGELAVIGAICTLFPDLKTGIMAALPKHPAGTRQIERILNICMDSFSRAADEMLLKTSGS